MAEEKETIEDDDSIDIEEDKTSDDKNEEDKEEDKGDKPDKSEIAQKIKYREKWKDASTKIQTLEAELANLKKMDTDIGKKPADDAEARAQKYIRDQAREVAEEILKAKEAHQEKITRDFSEKVEEILEDNPDITEEELLDAVEEYEVEPNVALKILRKSTAGKKEKPKMPQAKRGSAESEPEKKKSDDSKKTMWQILQEETNKLKK